MLHCFKRRHCEKTLVGKIYVYIQRRSRPADRMHLKFLFFFHAETDVLVPVLSQSTDVLVVNFAVVLKFPNNGYLTNDQ